MPELTYHAPACALLGVAGRVSALRLEQLARRQRELGVRLPEAVVEWYAVEGAVELQAAHCEDRVLGLAELGLPYGDEHDDYVAEGMLLIANENQDCYTLAVPLHEGADPPVQLMDPFDLELAEAVALRETFAPSFSDWVLACAWDAGAHHAAHQLALEQRAFTADTLAALRATLLTEAPATGLADQPTYRFGSARQWLTVTAFQGEATVRAAAETEPGLGELLALLPGAA